MAEKLFMIDPERCTGCRLCEMVCAVKHTGSSNPKRSRIRVVKWEDKGVYLPNNCRQCRKAPCMDACPEEALRRDTTLDAVIVDQDACIGCYACVDACPFGAMGFDDAGVAFKCDLCGGDPQCVRFCDIKAVDYIEVKTHRSQRMRESAADYCEMLRKQLSQEE